MIKIKDKKAQEGMINAGKLLSEIFLLLSDEIKSGVSTLNIDAFIERQLDKKKLVSQSKGYMGYKHVSCVSVNNEVVHGVPSERKIFKNGDLAKVDVCAAHRGYCADMARCFFVGDVPVLAKKLVDVAQCALDNGISRAVDGGRLGDVSAAIQSVVEENNFSVVRNFAGHGIGAYMHEAPEILNYGIAGQGVFLKSGMAFAIEPMINAGNFDVVIGPDGWTAKTFDGSLSAHIEDTIIITDNGPKIITRLL